MGELGTNMPNIAITNVLPLTAVIQTCSAIRVFATPLAASCSTRPLHLPMRRGLRPRERRQRVTLTLGHRQCGGWRHRAVLFGEVRSDVAVCRLGSLATDASRVRRPGGSVWPFAAGYGGNRLRVLSRHSGGTDRGCDVHEPDGFREFVVARSAALVRSAWLLTGNEADAQDLVQTALARVWSRWPRVVRKDAPEPYVRQVMLSSFLTWRRRRWRAEVSAGVVPERGDPRDEFAEADVRGAVQAALRELPPRQRAVIVLRFFDDLTETQTADALGCSVGTVKSQSAKALAKLRATPLLRGTWDEEEIHRDTG